MKTFKTFGELGYERPDFEAIERFYKVIIGHIKTAGSYDEVKQCILREEEFSAHVSTMSTIVSIRHTVDTSDPFYDEEEKYINRKYPEVLPFIQKFGLALLESPYRKQIDEEFGEFYLKNIRLEADSFSEKNISLIQEECELTDRYQRLVASCKISFRGEECNLHGIMKYFSFPDREVRKEAWKKYSEFFRGNEKEMGEIFDRLVKLRNEMGVNMGFENFVPLGYMQQGRLDYGEKDVEAFRKQVQEVIVPFCCEIYKAQAKRLGVEKIMCYDEEFLFPDGNAVPVGNRSYLVNQAGKMYDKMSPETREFFNFMLEHKLMDLDNKPNKAATGYMTYLPDYKAPFVFSCFNGTTGDVDVLTHEMGHAFAGYMAMRTQPLMAQWSESTDIAEIHSMTMEQFAYPYAELFFKDKADKYRFQHLQQALTFVPFGVAVDEFQHIVYKNPQLTPEERTAEWHKLEEKYMPWRDYGEDEFFGKGGWWYHKLHIFHYPFYYINYTLTTMGALEFKRKQAENKEAAWRDYIALCKAGGSMGYLDTLRAANLSVPFEKGSVKKAAGYAMEIIGKELEKGYGG